MKYELCNYLHLDTFSAWLASLSSPIDSFLEEHVVESAFHRISCGGREVGSFAIYSNSLLTQFYLIGDARRHGQKIFTDILQQYEPTTALVPTCDEFFLSHVLDKHSSLSKQAYFFVDGAQESISGDPGIAESEYRLAVPEDLPVLRKIKDSIIEDPQQRIQKHELHVGYQDHELTAIGLIEPSILWPDRASIGMLTHESHRRKGIGTKTVRYLAKVCHNNGLTPLAGCAYGNTNSLMTLQAAGMQTATRLLKLTF